MARFSTRWLRGFRNLFRTPDGQALPAEISIETGIQPVADASQLARFGIGVQHNSFVILNPGIGVTRDTEDFSAILETLKMPAEDHLVWITDLGLYVDAGTAANFGTAMATLIYGPDVYDPGVTAGPVVLKAWDNIYPYEPVAGAGIPCAVSLAGGDLIERVLPMPIDVARGDVLGFSISLAVAMTGQQRLRYGYTILPRGVAPELGGFRS